MASPADFSPLSPVEKTTPVQLQEAVKQARAAQVYWGTSAASTREAACLEFAKRLLTQSSEAAKIMSQETGRSEIECLGAELTSLGEYVKRAIQISREALKSHPVKLSALDFPGKKAVTEPVARGVVGIIAPWNYPMSNFFKSIFPALLSGNGVVMKPSEFTPRSGAFLHSIASKCFPTGLIGIVQGGGDVGALLVDSVDAIVFTGSIPSGKKVAAQAAARLIPSSLELGGKDAAIVLNDCDLDRTVLGVAQWSIHNAGQNCAAIERVYVEAGIADTFVEKLATLVSKFRVAPAAGPTELGPLQNENQMKIVEAHVAQAISSGAKVLCGGKRTGVGLGYFPTVIDHCTQAMLVVSEETFGPVIAIIRVKDSDEAVKLANDSRYGLNGSVWTRDLKRGAELARQLEVGIAYVNNHSFGGILADVPWTGVRESGTGVAASRFSYSTFVRPRTVLIDASKNPDPWWMPVNDDSAIFSQGLVAQALGAGIGNLLKLGGLVKRRAQALKEAVK